jgi:hypothetical protein
LPFPFLITHILRKKGIKGTSEDGPITESPYFDSIQWNQSLSHMPKGAPAPEPKPKRVAQPEPEPMDIPKMVAKPERATKQEEQPNEEEEYEEGILIRASDLFTLPGHPRGHISQIADLQRDARQDRLEVQEMFRAILDRLPPAARPSAPPPAP